MLLALFAVQHSAMARPGFKRWWTRLVPHSVERSTYVLFASVVLLFLYLAVEAAARSGLDRAEPDRCGRPAGDLLVRLGLLLVSTFLISHFELFGLKQVFARLLGRAPSAVKFHTPLFYRVASVAMLVPLPGRRLLSRPVVQASSAEHSPH